MSKNVSSAEAPPEFVPVPLHEGFKFRYLFYTLSVVFLLLALMTHHPADLNLLSGAGSVASAYQNWIGPAGAYVARFFFVGFGLAAWPILFLLLLSAVRPFMPPPVRRRGYVPAMAVLFLGLTILFGMYPESCIHGFLCFSGTELLGIGHAKAPLKALSGGVLGQYLAAPPIMNESISAGLIRRGIGEIGTLISGLVMVGLGLFFVFWMDWKSVIVHVLNAGESVRDVPPLEEEPPPQDAFKVKQIVPKTLARDVPPLPEVPWNQRNPNAEPEMPPSAKKEESPVMAPVQEAPSVSVESSDESIGAETAQRLGRTMIFGQPIMKSHAPVEANDAPSEIRVKSTLEAPVVPGTLFPGPVFDAQHDAPSAEPAPVSAPEPMIPPRPAPAPVFAPEPPPFVTPEHEKAPEESVEPVLSRNAAVLMHQQQAIQRVPPTAVEPMRGPSPFSEAEQEKALDRAMVKASGETHAAVSASAPYELPSVHMLTKVDEPNLTMSPEIIAARGILEQTLYAFKIDGEVSRTVVGPRVLRFELELERTVNVKKIQQIEQNIAKDLSAKSIRILAPVPGKSTVGIEVPNPDPKFVFLRQIMENAVWKKNDYEIPIVLGKDVDGNAYVTDLAKMPHLLIAGTTGSGKSICMNTLIMSMMFKFSPDDLKLIMVDPKIVEMASYTDLPHLITPVLNDPPKVPLALRWAVNEMERRYRVLADVRVKNIIGFNTRPKGGRAIDSFNMPIPEKMPYLVIIIDELADMMMANESRKDIETSIARIAQKGRAAGVHLVVATQRPTANVLTGIIKANLPTRIAFRVQSNLDSRVILDSVGAENLLGKGDMIFLAPGGINPERIQGAFSHDEDIAKVVQFICSQRTQNFLDSVLVEPEPENSDDDARPARGGSDGRSSAYSDDDFEEDFGPVLERYLRPGDSKEFKDALKILFLDRKISTSYIQRRLTIGYNRAADIVDQMEQRGLIGPSKDGGSKRDILVFDELAERD